MLKILLNPQQVTLSSISTDVTIQGGLTISHAANFAALRETAPGTSMIAMVHFSFKKFLDEGNPIPLLEEAFKHYRQTNTISRIQETPGTRPPTRFTQFHARFKKMEKILATHWPMLLEDPHLKNSLTLPKVAYRKARNIKVRLPPANLSA